jgi:Zn-dependent protease with chaperone function
VALAPEVLAPVVVTPGLGASEVLPAEVKANRRRALMLCLLAGVLPAVVIGAVLGIALGPVIGLVALVVVALVVAYGLWAAAPSSALQRIGAVPLSERDNPRLFNVTDGLCATFGLHMPELYVVFDSVPNSCALGRDPGSGAVVVTSGLLDLMGPIELEGVMAHELAHVKRGDNGVSVVAMLLSRIGGEAMLQRCVGRSREYRADVVGASAVRFPRGLLDALSLMERAPAPAGNSLFGAERFGATRWVWIDPSVGHRDEPVEVGDLNATEVRVAALREW